MPMLEENRQPDMNEVRFDGGSVKQRRQMLIALALLLAALIVVLYKDWQFWYPSTATVESEPSEPSASQTTGESQRVPIKGQITAASRSKSKKPATEVAATPPETNPAPVITNLRP